MKMKLDVIANLRQRAQMLLDQEKKEGFTRSSFHAAIMLEVLNYLDVWRRALEDLTPQGSEFVNDVEACVTYVKQTRDRQFESVKNAKRREKIYRDAIEKHREANKDVGEFDNALYSVLDRVKKVDAGDGEDQKVAQ